MVQWSFFTPADALRNIGSRIAPSVEHENRNPITVFKTAFFVDC